MRGVMCVFDVGSSSRSVTYAANANRVAADSRLFSPISATAQTQDEKNDAEFHFDLDRRNEIVMLKRIVEMPAGASQAIAIVPHASPCLFAQAVVKLASPMKIG